MALRELHFALIAERESVIESLQMSNSSAAGAGFIGITLAKPHECSHPPPPPPPVDTAAAVANRLAASRLKRGNEQQANPKGASRAPRPTDRDSDVGIPAVDASATLMFRRSHPAVKALKKAAAAAEAANEAEAGKPSATGPKKRTRRDQPDLGEKR
jgi:hypothetical protein